MYEEYIQLRSIIFNLTTIALGRTLENHHKGVSYTDLEEAFDRVTRLLCKLKRIYLHSDLIDLIKAFLGYVKQLVELYGVYFSWLSLNRGIPIIYHTMLGPSLFIIYIKD